MKTMNAGRLLAWGMVVAMPLWFGSCKKDGNETINPAPNSVEGNWKISGMKITAGSKTIDYLDYIKTNGGTSGADVVACLTDTKITFNSNAKITGTPSPLCKSDGADDYNPATNNSTWKVTGNKLTITDEDGPETYDLSVNSSTMTWSIQEQEDLDNDGVKDTLTTVIEFKRV